MWNNKQHETAAADLKATIELMNAQESGVWVNSAWNDERNEEIRRLYGAVDDLKAEKKKIRHDTNIEIGATNRIAQMFNERNIEMKTENTKHLMEIANLNNLLNVTKTHIKSLNIRLNSPRSAFKTDSGIQADPDESKKCVDRQVETIQFMRVTIHSMHLTIQSMRGEIERLTAENKGQKEVMGEKIMVDIEYQRDKWNMAAERRGEALADMIAHSKKLSLRIRGLNHALLASEKIFVELMNSQCSGRQTANTALKGKGVVDAALDA